VDDDDEGERGCGGVGVFLSSYGDRKRPLLRDVLRSRDDGVANASTVAAPPDDDDDDEARTAAAAATATAADTLILLLLEFVMTPLF